MSGLSLLERLSPAPIPPPLATSISATHRRPKRGHAFSSIDAKTAQSTGSTSSSRWAANAAADPPLSPTKPSLPSVMPAQLKPSVADVELQLGQLKVSDGGLELMPPAAWSRKRGGARSRWDLEGIASDAALKPTSSKRIPVEHMATVQAEKEVFAQHTLSPASDVFTSLPTSLTPIPASAPPSPTKSINWADDDEDYGELPEIDEEWTVPAATQPFVYMRQSSTIPTTILHRSSPAASPQQSSPPPSAPPSRQRHQLDKSNHHSNSPIRKSLNQNAPSVRRNQESGENGNKGGPTKGAPARRRKPGPAPSTVFARLSGISKASVGSGAAIV